MIENFESLSHAWANEASYLNNLSAIGSNFLSMVNYYHTRGFAFTKPLVLAESLIEINLISPKKKFPFRTV